MGKYAEQTCCFTGHRDIPAGEEIKIKTRVYHRIQPLIQQGVIYYGVGGALGFDRMMSEYLLQLRKDNKRMKIIGCFRLRATAPSGRRKNRPRLHSLTSRWIRLSMYQKSQARAHILRVAGIWWTVRDIASVTAISSQVELPIPSSMLWKRD